MSEAALAKQGKPLAFSASAAFTFSGEPNWKREQTLAYRGVFGAGRLDVGSHRMSWIPWT